MPQGALQRRSDDQPCQLRLSPSPALPRINPRPPYRYLCSAAVERRDDILGEPPELLFELLGGQSLGPVDHEILQARILRLDRFDPLDDLRRRPTEPSLLFNAIAQRRHPRRRSWGAPSPALLIGIAHKPKRSEPFVALVVRRLDATDRLFMAVGKVHPCHPEHIWDEMQRAAVPEAGRMEGANHVIEDFFAVQGDHRLQAVFRHHIDGPAAGYRHPYLDRQVFRPWHYRNFLKLVAAIGD